MSSFQHTRVSIRIPAAQRPPDFALHLPVLAPGHQCDLAVNQTFSEPLDKKIESYLGQHQLTKLKIVSKGFQESPLSSSPIFFFFLSSDSMRTWSFSIPVLICLTSSCVEFRREAISPFSSREASRDCERRHTSPSNALRKNRREREGLEPNIL